MRAVEGVLLFLAIVADVLGVSVMGPSFVIYLGNCLWVLMHLPGLNSEDKKVLFLVSMYSFLAFMTSTFLILTQFLDYALREFVPMEGPLQSAIDKVLKGITWSTLAISVYRIYSTLPLLNPFIGDELNTFIFWTLVFTANVRTTDFFTTRQESPRFEQMIGRGHTNTPPNPNEALLTPPNQTWDPMDATLAILFIVSDFMSNYLVPSLTIFMTKIVLGKVIWEPSGVLEGSINIWLGIGLGISLLSSWTSILTVLERAFGLVAPPGGIHRSTIVQILCTLNGLWFGVAFYNLSLDLPMTSHSLNSAEVMTSIGYWALTLAFLIFKDFEYDPPPPRPHHHRRDHDYDEFRRVAI